MARELDIEKVRAMDVDDMELKVKSIEEELFNLRFRNAMKQLENPLEIRNLRKDLARLKTVLRQHELEKVAKPAAKKAAAKTAAPTGAGKRAVTRRSAGTKAAKKTAIKRKVASLKAARAARKSKVKPKGDAR